MSRAALAPLTVLALVAGAAVAPAASAASAASADVTAPVLLAHDLAVTSVDTAYAPRAVPVRVRVGDDASGVADVVVTLVSPSGERSASGSAGEPAGGVRDGAYEVPVTLPRYSETGTWSVQVVLRDHSGNLRMLSREQVAATGPAGVVVSASADGTAPRLVAQTLRPAWVDTTTAARTVSATVDLRDDLSGLADAHATFAHASGGTVSGYARTDAVDLREGRLALAVVFPAGSAPGTWTLRELVLRDRAGNVRQLSTAALTAAGAPTRVRVASPLPSAPGQVTAAAGPRSATVSWTAPARTGGSPVTGYLVTPYRDGRAGAAVRVAAPATRVAVPGLVAGAAYRFSVRAVTAAGAGAESARTATVRPLAG